MVIVCVDKRHVDGGFGERFAGFQPGEAGADDHHLRPLRCLCMPVSHDRRRQLETYQRYLIYGASAANSTAARRSLRSLNANQSHDLEHQFGALRIGLVGKFIKAVQPDILCLQETKCPDNRFPRKQFRRLGYEHFALNGQKGYHGVVVVSRLPFESTAIKAYCGKSDCRRIAVALGERAGLKDPVTLHNFYVPAGGDVQTRL